MGPPVSTIVGTLHRTAADQHPRHDLVAGPDTDEPVEAVALDHHLDRVRDVLPRGQRVPHPLVTHRDPVADPDHAELERHPAAGRNPLADPLRELAQVDVARVRPWTRRSRSR